MKVTGPRFAALTKLTEGLLSVLSVRRLEVSQIHGPCWAGNGRKVVTLTDSPRDTSPLERLKRLASDAQQRGEIHETPVQGTDKADRSPAHNVVDIAARAEPSATADPEGGELLASGWQPKERLGKTVWRDPADGFWLSREMALVILERRK